jgi:hypothetical protein
MFTEKNKKKGVCWFVFMRYVLYNIRVSVARYVWHTPNELFFKEHSGKLGSGFQLFYNKKADIAISHIVSLANTNEYFEKKFKHVSLLS